MQPVIAAFFLVLCLSSFSWVSAMTITIQDASGREVTVPKQVEHIICSGPGCVRLLTYLEATNLIVAVDDIESGRNQFDARPYALAHPELSSLPIFGQFRGADNPELIVNLPVPPQVIFKTFPTMGYNPIELQKRTGIPVITVHYGDLGKGRDQFYSALRTMGAVLGKQARAEAVITFFEKHIAELALRTKKLTGHSVASVYVGGVAFKGAQGLLATEPHYPPFQLINLANIATSVASQNRELSHAIVGKESLVMWDPQYIFLDLATLQLGNQAGGLYELRHDPVYSTLRAATQGQVYGLLPYNWYAGNYGSILTNAYFIGKTLFPEAFQDISPVEIAGQVYTFLVGKDVFDEMNQAFGGHIYQSLMVR